MKTNELSTCSCTTEVDACREFSQQHFSARTVFDCGWYVNLCIGGDGPAIQFMQPQGDMPVFGGTGVMLNFNADAQYKRLTDAGLQPAMPLEDHPWGDRAFSIVLIPVCRVHRRTASSDARSGAAGRPAGPSAVARARSPQLWP